MPSYLFLLLLGALGVAGGGGGSSSGSSSGVTSRTTEDEDDDAPDPVTPSPDTPAPPSPAVVAPPNNAIPDDMPNVPASAYDIGWSGLTAEEQMLVELVNRARLDPAGEIGRQDEGFAAGVTTQPQEALAVVETLSDASRAHSEDMDNRDFFAHRNLDGQSPSDRAIEEGHGSRYVGENIGWIGSTRTNFDAQARVESHHDNLWDSDGHQQNFMSDNWSEIGVGYDYGSYRGYDGSTFATEMFSDRGETYLTGVVIEDEDNDAFYDIGEGQGDVRITAFNEDDVFTTATWDSGGYSLALPPGTYRVVFEGGDLDTVYETDVTIGNENVKLDVIDDAGNVATSVSAAMLADPVMLPQVEPVQDTLVFDALDDDDAMILF